ncbi:hypothetical protein PPSIR1_27848 [Plesiocystis pacifica SIR-1]|uniref:Uncharacterized protein n=1 Tax=Plesiocystis pacifica SIR-1 TaxID=391625 RepID=A6GI85_9BACT|nr:hypothetical protein [Plesiocystis pacifica]EDM74429.1 hypothetical protein PPSIR1_27848 [Plesiocystis pacifica SIR-1]
MRESDDARFEPGPDLEFEHVGTMEIGDRLVLCDVEFLAPRFAGMVAGGPGTPGARVRLDFEAEVEAGTWQVLAAYALPRVPDGDGDAPPPAFVILTHDRELEHDLPLDHAEAVALLRIDSGRFCAVDVELRGDMDIQRAVLEAPREQVPCMLTPLGGPEGSPPRGTLIDLDRAGVFEVYAPAGTGEAPRTALFLTLSG